METLKKILNWLKSQVSWIKVVVPILVCILVIVLLFSSCGVARTRASATIKNKATNTTTNVTISGTNGGSVSVSASPEITVDLKSVDTLKPSKIKSNVL